MYSVPGKKYDNNKPSIGLVDPDFLTGLAKVLDFGAEKYGLNNWRNGIHVSRIISACYRHLGEINKRHDVDSESNLPAVYHLASEVMFLAWMLENKKEYDDRYKKATPCPAADRRKEIDDLHKEYDEFVEKYKWPGFPPPIPGLRVTYGDNTNPQARFTLGDNPA